MRLRPCKVFLVKGKGVHSEKLNSFELALRDAGISGFNLVYVSSILPPHCQVVDAQDGLKYFEPGEIVHCVLSRAETDEPGRRIASAIGMAFPAAEAWERGQHGYISECHQVGMTVQQASDLAEDQAAEMLASLMGVESVNWTTFWDPKKDVYSVKGRPVKTKSICQSAVGAPLSGPDGWIGETWTTVIAAAVFVMPGQLPYRSA